MESNEIKRRKKKSKKIAVKESVMDFINTISNNINLMVLNTNKPLVEPKSLYITYLNTHIDIIDKYCPSSFM